MFLSLRLIMALVVGLLGLVVPVSPVEAPLQALPNHRSVVGAPRPVGPPLGPPRPPLGPVSPEAVGLILRTAMAHRIAAEYPGVDAALGGHLAGLIVRAAASEGLDPWLIYSVIKVESNFEPGSRGSAGERGLMQILPATGRSLWRQRNWEHFDEALLEHPAVNIELGSFYLATLMRANGGDPGRALTSYNTGRTAGAPNGYARRVLRVYGGYAGEPGAG